MRGKLMNHEFKNSNFLLDKSTQGVEGREGRQDQMS